MEEEKTTQDTTKQYESCREAVPKETTSQKTSGQTTKRQKTDGPAAEEEEERAGQFSDSDSQHDLPAAKVKRKLLLQPSSPFQCSHFNADYPSRASDSSLARSLYDKSSCGGQVPSCLDILQDEYLVGHGGSSILKSSKVKWEALKKQPRDDNPLEERYGAAPFKMNHSSHLLAGLLQIVGVLAPSPCRTGKKDCGRRATCVISHDYSSIDIAKGACANCLYTSARKCCSFGDSLPQDTADTDTNPELKVLEGKGSPTHFAAREAIKQAQQHNGYQLVTMSGNLGSGKAIYQKYRCFRYDHLTSGGVKIDDPCFWSIRVDLVDGSRVVQQPEGTHSHDAVDYSMPKPPLEM